MLLGVNGIRLVRARSGVARAIGAILRCMGEIEHPFREIRVYTPEPLDPSIALPACARNVVLPSWLPPGLWEQLVLPRAHGSQHLLFCPSYVIPVLARCPTLLVHHGSYEGYAEASKAYSRWARMKARVSYTLSAWRATRVSTVSYYSRRDMARFYGIAPERIDVVPEGVDTALFRPIRDRSLLADWRRRVLGDDLPFLLYVGKPTRRRNLPNLIRAFDALKREKRLPHKLLLIGTSLPGVSFQPLIAQLGLTREVVTLDHAPHDEIAVAYNASEMLVYPSSYEGFGMPVLEAMACGTPVVALDNTAFPEFAGGVACLLPDAEVGTLKAGIEGLLSDERRRMKMAEDGPRRAAAYDWHIVTQRYVGLMCSIVGAAR